MKKSLKGKAPSKIENRGSRQILYVLFFVFVLMVILSFIYSSVLESYWPYIIILLVLIFAYLCRVKGKKKLFSLSIFYLLILMFGMLFFYYSVLPLHKGYQPITIPGMMTIFQLEGKFQVFYYPNYPIQNDEISFKVRICDTSLINCYDPKNYTLSAYFEDELQNKNVIYDNLIVYGSNYTKLQYFGFPIHIDMKYPEIKKDLHFIIPRPSFLQTVNLALNNHPIYGIFAIVSTLITISLFIAGTVNLVITIFIFFKNKPRGPPAGVG